MDSDTRDRGSRSGPHQGQPVGTTGAPLSGARAAVLMVHGRGASAGGMLALAEGLPRTKVAYVAPQAAGGTWYPNSFLAPLGSNEPGLGSALQAIGDVLRDVEERGIPSERTVLLGFSQGACLALEFAARNPRRYGGVVGLSGGLIGTGDRAEVPPPDDKLFEYSGSLAGTPVFVACSDPDPHIPLERVRRTAEVMRELGGDVTERIDPGMPHSIKEDELRFVEGLVTKVVDL